MMLLCLPRSVRSRAWCADVLSNCRIASVGLAGLLLLVAGCGGPAGPKREAFGGGVSREGYPIDAGTIMFQPEGGGPAASAEIKNGEYLFTTITGPVAGKHKVQIVYFPPRGEVPEGTPKKDAPVLVDDRFKKKMPPNGWLREAEVGVDQKDRIDFAVDE